MFSVNLGIRIKLTALFILFSCCLGKFSFTKRILNFAHHNREFILKLFSASEILQYFRFNRKYCNILEIVIDIIWFSITRLSGFRIFSCASEILYFFDSIENIVVFQIMYYLSLLSWILTSRDLESLHIHT